MHQANGSGLQQHSIGEDYPWTVVGTIDAFGDTKWYSVNLETNQRTKFEFYNSFLAHKWAQQLAHNAVMKQWIGDDLIEWRTS